MKVLIISDTHRRDDRFLALIERIKPIDMLIHCGDTEGSEELYMAGVDCPVESLRETMISLRIFRGKGNLMWETTGYGSHMVITIMCPWEIPY